MALNFPWEMFMQAQQEKNRNRQQMYQDIAGIGQGLGQGMGAVGEMMQRKKEIMQQQKQKQQWQDTINQLLQDPNVPQQVKSMLPVMSQRPELMGQLGPELFKLSQPPKQPTVWHPVSGMLSKSGKPMEINEATGEYKEAPLEATPSGGAFGAMAGVRRSQNIMQDLPSRSNPNTAAGAAYMVKVAARQGKAIIGKPGSPQQISLAASDLARAVQRSAPQLETLQGSSFSNNYITKMNLLTQKMTANPQGKDVPKIRRQIYDLLDDLDKTASPWIDNQLKTTEDIWEGALPKNWQEIKKRERGENVPDVPFIEGIGGPPGSIPSGKNKSFLKPGEEAAYEAYKRQQLGVQ
jgi:hypothetical protein